MCVFETRNKWINMDYLFQYRIRFNGIISFNCIPLHELLSEVCKIYSIKTNTILFFFKTFLFNTLFKLFQLSDKTYN